MHGNDATSYSHFRELSVFAEKVECYLENILLHTATNMVYTLPLQTTKADVHENSISASKRSLPERRGSL